MMPSTSGGSIKELLDQAKPTNDPVMHPHHYSRWKMEAIEFIAINNLCWWLANVIKYCMRYDAKDGLQDLYKARSYLDMQIRLLEGHERWWEKPVKEQRELSLNDCVASSFPNKPCGPTKPAVFCDDTKPQPWRTSKCCGDYTDCLAYGPGCDDWIGVKSTNHLTCSDGELRRFQKGGQ